MRRVQSEIVGDISVHMTDVREIKTLTHYVRRHGATWGFSDAATLVVSFPREATQQLLRETDRLKVYKITFPDGAIFFHHRVIPEGVMLRSGWADILSESHLSIQEGGKE
jgi:hypothetical protein